MVIKKSFKNKILERIFTDMDGMLYFTIFFFVISAIKVMWSKNCYCCSVTQSHDQPFTISLWPHGLQHDRLPVLHCLPVFAQTPVHWIGDTIQACELLSTPSPPALSLSQHQDLYQWVGFSHEAPMYWSFSCSISPSTEYSGLIFFRIDWFDHLIVQGTLTSLLQLWSSAFFMVQLSHPYMTTGATIDLNIWTLSAKWCLCFLIHTLGLS